ncbi:hypothetical protein NPIL_329251 [Nephila pilipes]|uniref:Uncharacterized protein n=1 Tax=Nephila pilipes TaxID=299642 RepID=A0A8X6QAQ2_NEPPI|nr:hypothetical protein NPIL_329251 [Nephila pilipes]
MHHARLSPAQQTITVLPIFLFSATGSEGPVERRCNRITARLKRCHVLAGNFPEELAPVTLSRADSPNRQSRQTVREHQLWYPMPDRGCGKERQMGRYISFLPSSMPFARAASAKPTTKNRARATGF